MNKQERELNRQLWLQRISEQHSSGMTQDEWCRQNNISVSTFRYWLRRLRDEHESGRAPEWLKINIDADQSVGQIIVSEPDISEILKKEEISISYDGITVKIPFQAGIVGMQQIINILKTT